MRLTLSSSLPPSNLHLSIHSLILPTDSFCLPGPNNTGAAHLRPQANLCYASERSRLGTKRDRGVLDPWRLVG